nr:TraR/DksA C4-type zinc finger protein [Nitrospirota bacterium]
MAKTAAKAVKPKPARGKATAKSAKPKPAGAPKRATPTAKNKAKKPAVRYTDIRRDLQRQRADLLKEAGIIVTKRNEFEPFPDLSDQATAEMDQNFSLRLKEREQKLLKKIDEALDRITTRTYGICERCEQKIPYKRLKARPVTTLCIECKTLQEYEEKIRR